MCDMRVELTRSRSNEVRFHPVLMKDCVIIRVYDKREVSVFIVLVFLHYVQNVLGVLASGDSLLGSSDIPALVDTSVYLVL
jgi:hypothetical protein